MTINIDEQLCKKNNVTPAEALFLYALTSSGLSAGQLKSKLLKKGAFTEDLISGESVCTRAKNAINKIVTVATEEERLTKLAERMREVYPEGKMPGTNYYYRCNMKEIIVKLKYFFKIYGDSYTDDQIIEATRNFVLSFQGNQKYMPLLKYFIAKNKVEEEEDGEHKVNVRSQLADYLENHQQPVKQVIADYICRN